MKIFVQQASSDFMEARFIEHPLAFQKKEHPSGQRFVVIGPATDLADVLDRKWVLEHAAACRRVQVEILLQEVSELGLRFVRGRGLTPGCEEEEVYIRFLGSLPPRIAAIDADQELPGIAKSLQG